MTRAWTKPFHGVQHLLQAGSGFQFTVNDYGRFTVAKLFTPGCGFSPQERTFHGRGHLERAKAWLEQQVDLYDPDDYRHLD